MPDVSPVPQPSPTINPTVVAPTTTVTIPPPAVPAPQYYDGWGVMGLVVAGIVIFLSIFNGAASGVQSILGFFKSRKDLDKERDAPLELRIKSLEETTKSLRSNEWLDKEYDRLERKIDHEKNNRQLITDGLANQLRAIAAGLADEQRARTRLEAQVEGVVSNAQRVENALERMSERIEERFDRIQELLLAKH